MEKKLVHQVPPAYPREAMRQQLKGTVRMQIVVDGEGNVIDTQALSGSSVLAGAAADALRTWRYQPTLRNQQPVEVLTEVEFRFNYQRQRQHKPHETGEVQIGPRSIPHRLRHSPATRLFSFSQGRRWRRDDAG